MEPLARPTLTKRSTTPTFGLESNYISCNNLVNRRGTPLLNTRSPRGSRQKETTTMTKKMTQAEQVQETVALGFPEVGSFGEDGKKELQKFYKHLTNEQLEEWVELEGLEIKPTDSEQIYRMRLAMAILYLHYPKATAKKKVSKYAKYTLEDLVELAIEKDVAVEPTEDERIMRMRTIMALRASGHIA